MTGRRRTSQASRVPRQRVIGAIIVALAAALLYVSFTANRGLPLQSKYRLTVDVPNADRLAVTNEVRIAGVRVGQVQGVHAQTDRRNGRVFSRIDLDLDGSVGRIAADTRVRVRPASVLGATYVDLVLGDSAETVPDGGALPLANAVSDVELTDLLDVFDRRTAREAQRALISLGDGLSGRGTDINAGLRELEGLLAPLTRVSATASAPASRLRELIAAYDAFVRELAPAAGPLASLTTAAAATFGAFEGERAALGQVLEVAPSTERATTVAFRALHRPLDELAGLLKTLRGPVERLRPALTAADRALTAGVRPLQLLPAFSGRLRTTFTVLDRLTRDRTTDGTLRKLDELLAAAGQTLEVLTPAQVQCNVISLFAQSFGWAYGSVGFGQGPPMAGVGLTHVGAAGESMQNAKPSPGLAVNNTPNENYEECETGNEPYPETNPFVNPPSRPISIGNPAGLQDDSALDTDPPPGVLERARSAGLKPTTGDTP
jgi:phospholipid/cholesterol/gamma-HCH transport system substrate-binding protein